ncbi:MAG: GatB/YqeY domain-containing protein [Propionibacteriaceae bacterium]|nr:GatB/YqeY domain-containing protein [Propionibacteriaceae bacterium]
MAATKTRLQADLANALRAKDEFAKSTIRMMLAAITVEEVAGNVARALSDAEELAVLTKEQRKRRDSAETYAEAGRQELADREAAEAEFIAAYLPAPLTAEELDELVAAEIAKVVEAGEPLSMKHMGPLVKAVNAVAQGRAPGAEVAARVKAAIQG